MKVDIEIVDCFPLPDTSHGRSQGIHVSRIISNIGYETGILTNEWAEELSLVDVRDMSNLDIVAQLRIHMGLAWEEHYLPLIPEVAKHPGEMELDGVYMTPDGESLSVIFTVPSKRYGIKIHEAKCTYKSINTVGPTAEAFVSEKGQKSNLLWLLQIKSYCKAKGTRHAVLHVLFVCGDYKFPIRPMLVRYNLEFTQRELDNCWGLLQEYKELTLRGEN